MCLQWWQIAGLIIAAFAAGYGEGQAAGDRRSYQRRQADRRARIEQLIDDARERLAGRRHAEKRKRRAGPS